MLRPTGNLTFLFTDLERSSQLWEQHPQAMGRALARHDALLRALFEEHKGHPFKAMGDAFCVAFANALDAVEAALAVQRRLAMEPWEDTGPLRVRIAVHSGEAEERDGDYFGQTLNRTARLLSSGHGGQTLLSRVAAERVREKLPREVTLRDLGERRLKDLSKPERIFQVEVRDLPVEFPPLRSLEVLPNNLPAQVTSFVGREREMAQGRQLLSASRLVTFTGPGGTGKTRLALQLGADSLEGFSNGVWLVELAMISDPALVPEAVATVLEVREEAERPLQATLLDALRGRRMLLLLDNCEHLVAVCAELADSLLRHCPELRILATSREPLNIPGEMTWPVPSLGVNDLPRRRLSLEQVAALESVQLFVDRAAAVRPGFAITEENAETLATICFRLDGIPLAIELAAARVKVLTPAQILVRLDDRFHLLSGGSRTALPRQQTLSALIDWSYDLLTEKERMLLRRLSVFVRGRTLEMAEEVCAGEGIQKGEVLDLLGSLVDKSLVSVETEHEAEPRYVMLESVWDYASEKLVQSAESDLFRERHLAYFAQFAELAEQALLGPEQVEWLEKLETDLTNFRYALEWAETHPQALESALRLAGALIRFCEVRSYLREGRELYRALLAQATESIPALVRAKALHGAGRLAWCQDDDEEALRLFKEELLLEEGAGLRLRAGFTHAFLGFTYRNEGRAEEARGHLLQALETGAALKDERLVATARSGLGSLAGDAGDFAVARDEKERAMEVFRRQGDKWIIGLLAWSQGRVAIAQEDFASARAYFTEGARAGRELGNTWSVPYSLEGFGGVALGCGQAEFATRLYGAASVAREEAGLGSTPLERVAYEETLDRLRAALSAEAYREAWEAGRAWRADQALIAALESA